jgi:hypothetical protein
VSGGQLGIAPLRRSRAIGPTSVEESRRGWCENFRLLCLVIEGVIRTRYIAKIG